MLSESMSRLALFAFAAVLVSRALGLAACDPTTDPDRSDVANARTTVATNCDCGATTHGAYVSCAAQQANAVLVNKSCAGFVKKCAAHSTCGRPAAAVTCCLTTTRGTTCKIKKDAAHCTVKGTVGSCTSCCDACPAPGSGPNCPTTTTTTTTMIVPCENVSPYVDLCSIGECPPGQSCRVWFFGPSLAAACGCAADPACGTVPDMCGGNCPQGRCTVDPQLGCNCVGP